MNDTLRAIADALIPEYFKQPEFKPPAPGTVGKVPQASRGLADMLVGGAVEGASWATPAVAAKGAMAIGLPMAARRGIRAYHGSPHDFDRFDISKIGTGEGAQAYGHGLYFAEKEGVAREYRDSLAKRGYLWKGRNLSEAGETGNQYADAILSRMQEMGGNPDPLNAADTVYARLQKAGQRAPWSEIRDALKVVERDLTRTREPGRMYEVNINAAPEQFLDWDKPLSAQSALVQEAVGVTPQVRSALSDYLATTKSKTDFTPDFWAKMKLADDDLRGSSIIQKLAEVRRDGYTEYDYPLASQSLREAGIPGIRYLDQGSRGAGEGTSNYVVFDDSLIDILRKYGIVGGAMGLGGAAAANQNPGVM